jgi:hypothetical protein
MNKYTLESNCWETSSHNSTFRSNGACIRDRSNTCIKDKPIFGCLYGSTTGQWKRYLGVG